jgi:chromosome segregation ATPase
MESAAALKKLKIKTGALTRNVKEYKGYNSEVHKQTIKLEALKQETDDAGKIRQNEEVLAESMAMLPHCKSRIQDSINDLEANMVEGQDETEEVKNAMLALQEAKAFLETI